MRGAGADGADVILAGVTGSQTSMRAAAYATGLARRQDARLVLAWVRSLDVPVMADPYAAVALASALTRPVGPADWSEIGDVLQLADVAVELIAPTGDPFHELDELAQRVRADVVVLGATTSRARRLLGLSVARRFIRSRRCPVIVVP